MEWSDGHSMELGYGLFQMAQPQAYEEMAREDRAAMRARRARLMEDWPKSEPTEEVLSRLGKMLAVIQESNEDMRVAVREMTAGNIDRTREVLMVVARAQAERIGEALGVAEVDCKFGVGTAEHLKQSANDLENISDDQARVLKNILKKRDEEQGGGMEGKATAVAKHHERPGEMYSSVMGARMGREMRATMGGGVMGGSVMGGGVMGGGMMGGGMMGGMGGGMGSGMMGGSMMGGGMMGGIGGVRQQQYLWPQQMEYGMVPSDPRQDNN